MVIERLETKLVSDELLASKEFKDLERVAEIICSGGIVGFPFNGVFGLFGDVDNSEAAERILQIKKRDPKRKLVLVAAPEVIGEYVDFSQTKFAEWAVIYVWKKLHALGIVLPASPKAPMHLVQQTENKKTILNIWTEYLPLRILTNHLRHLGKRALVGTSANISGEATLTTFAGLREAFEQQVDALVEDNFDHLPNYRKKSTSVIDLTGETPRLHRLGNVTPKEIAEILEVHGLGELYIPPDLIFVKPKHS